MAFPVNSKKKYTCIGLMSGTSLDGLDICLSTFEKNVNNTWRYSILKAQTLPYPNEIKYKLENAPHLSGEQLTSFDYEYGHYIGKIVNDFIKNLNEDVDFIASHGHTVFHNPSKGYTLQIGKGAAISSETGVPCISDFRSSDVCKGGQGAPLVPIGDKLLFYDYDICLNLGGIANLSYDDVNGERIAYDISPCNMMLNHLVLNLGIEFDKNGMIGKTGMVDGSLLNKMNSLDYYRTSNPKSLGREWFEQNILGLLNSAECSIEDKLRTSYEHIAEQITNATNSIDKQSLLITGGGAKNLFLIELIKQKSYKKVIVPDYQTIDFKEALIFAFLGVLFIEKEHSALASVTGSKANSICGCFYH